MRIFRMKRFILLSIVALALAVAEIAQASTIQLGIRSGATPTPEFGTSPWSGPVLCGQGGSMAGSGANRVPCVETDTAIITDGSIWVNNGLPVQSHGAARSAPGQYQSWARATTLGLAEWT